MGVLRSFNAGAFTLWPVTIIVSCTYITLFAGLLYTHHVVPSAPDNYRPLSGIDLSRAISDLQTISSDFHPYNSRSNDVVRNYILTRVEDILQTNKVTFTYEQTGSLNGSFTEEKNSKSEAIVFDDTVSNATFTGEPLIHNSTLGVYFEGNNIIVFIKGTAANDPQAFDALSGQKRCVLVNAHFDSVSTGYGATDDGVGVVSILQLISHYTSPGNRPKRCLVALFNNGEEEFLNGARVFVKHPLSDAIDVFLNLEGAGAGGRASMFRSTDDAITKAYRKSPYPFGTALSADGFRQGLVRSQTDYVVFNEILGYRGLDVAFMEPRSRYHTASDSSRETSVDSLWHMLSAALATTSELIAHPQDRYKASKGNEPVYFDLFGRTMGLISLSVLIDLTATLAVVTPILLILNGFFLISWDRYYILSRNPGMRRSNDDESFADIPAGLKTKRGFFRGIISIAVATAVTIGLAFLVVNVNPMIIYSSPYAVWSMMLSAWFTIAVILLKSPDHVRPTALQRLYCMYWVYFVSWIILIASLVFEFKNRVCGAYIAMFLCATSFVALFTCMLEQLTLPPKQESMKQAGTLQISDEQRLPRPTFERRASGEDQDREATETDALLGSSSRSRSRRNLGSDSVFARWYSSVTSKSNHTDGNSKGQEWAATLANGLWLPEFLTLAPLNIILIGQIGLFFTSAIAQTPADGSPVKMIYLGIAVLSTLLLLPITPFIHRMSGRVAVFTLCVFVGTLVYNLTAFPFSEHNRLKIFFLQQLDLDSANVTNEVTLTGIPKYIQSVADSIPSSTNQALNCSNKHNVLRADLTTCRWHNSLLPNIFHDVPEASVPANPSDPSTWMSLYAGHISDTAGFFNISGANTRGCKLIFDQPIQAYLIQGTDGGDANSGSLPGEGNTELRLWSRDWDKHWEVLVTWKDGAAPEEHTGRAVCLWSDANDPATIPALTEVKNFMPTWSIITKASDGLVEGSRAFAI